MQRGDERERCEGECRPQPRGCAPGRTIGGEGERSVSKCGEGDRRANRFGDLERAPRPRVGGSVAFPCRRGVAPLVERLDAADDRIAGGDSASQTQERGAQLHHMIEIVSFGFGCASSAASRPSASTSQIGSSSSSIWPSSASRALSGSIGMRPSTGACASSATRSAYDGPKIS